MLFISSCNEGIVEEKDAKSEIVTSTRSSPCGPQGVNCVVVLAQDYVYNNGPCSITLNMDITRCIDANGKVVFNFEDEGVPFTTNGFCTPLEDEIELAYEEFIAFFMDIATSQNNIDCSVGGVMSSRHIKKECLRLCEAPGNVGEMNVRWVPCAEEQGCCTTTIEWCYENGELVSSESVITEFLIGCIANTPNCNPTNDPLQAYEPCGGRCDR